MAGNELLYLDDDRLAALAIPHTEIADAIERAILAERSGKLWTAPKSAMMPGDGRYMMATLSAADDPQLTVVKTVMVSPGNPARGLPGINGAILLLDSETGLLRGVMDANWVTAVRTAGLSLVAARRLADPGAATVAFIGCGVQARSHLDAFAAEFPLAEVRAFGRGTANVAALCEAAGRLGLSATACETAQQALDGAGLVVSSVTLNYDLAPFLDARWLKPGAFAAITDLALPWQPETMAAMGTIVVDDLRQEEASDKPMVDRELVAGDLGDLVAGDGPARDPGRASAFVFRGLAVGDFAAAALAFERALGAGGG